MKAYKAPNRIANYSFHQTLVINYPVALPIGK